MKNNEIKTLKTQDLIEQLVRTAFLDKVSKTTETQSRKICEELAERGIIENSEQLFSIWRG